MGKKTHVENISQAGKKKIDYSQKDYRKKFEKKKQIAVGIPLGVIIAVLLVFLSTVWKDTNGMIINFILIVIMYIVLFATERANPEVSFTPFKVCILVPVLISIIVQFLILFGIIKV